MKINFLLACDLLQFASSVVRIKVHWLDHTCIMFQSGCVCRFCRTDNTLVHPSHSSIRQQVESSCDVDVTEDSFKVLSSSPNNLDLRILESLFIFKTRLKLNGNMHACVRVMATLCTSLMRDVHACVRLPCFRIHQVFLTFIFYVVLQLYSLPIFLVHLRNSNNLSADDGHRPETFFNIT